MVLTLSVFHLSVGGVLLGVRRPRDSETNMTRQQAEPVAVLHALERTTDEVFGRDDLVARLATGGPIRIKFGVDCTAPDLHLGHAVNLWMMRRLQDLGHVVVFLIGDATTRIGDPSGRSTTRPVLPSVEIERNAEALLEQVGTVLRTDSSAMEIRRNSEWFATLPITDLLAELAHVTVGQLLARDMFAERMREGRPIAGHEFLYPVLQGYDSVMVESDLTIVGSDQLFNEMMGRQIQARHGQRPQTVITSTITAGLDGGPKQSKSLNNYVGLTHPPREKFGRLMTLVDDQVGEWATVYTDLSPATCAALALRAGRAGSDARDAKLDLAEAIVARHHGAEKARRARDEFVAVFSHGGVPAALPELAVIEPLPLLDLVVRARPELSRSAARRLVDEGGVRLNGAQLREPTAEVDPTDGDVLQAGRRRWTRIRRVS